MKRKTLSLIGACMIASSLFFVGCGASNSETSQNEVEVIDAKTSDAEVLNDTISKEEQQKDSVEEKVDMWDAYAFDDYAPFGTFIDPETGVNYLFYHKGGITVRLNADGTPYVTPIENIKQ